MIPVLLLIFSGCFGLASAPQDVPQRPVTSSVPELFAAADQCMACHNGLMDPSGEDVSIGIDWRSSMMANAARDPYWQAAVRRETLDHPQAQAVIENECAACHMPMPRFQAKASGRKGEVFAHLPVSQAAQPEALMAADGVSCTVCHQIQDSKFGSKESFTAGFVIDTTTLPGRRQIYGPFDVDAGRLRIMESFSGFRPMKASHLQSAELCATCHTLFTHALDAEGNVAGELPEQVPYLEWRHSAYREKRTCQSCHMPEIEAEMQISSVLGQPREGFTRHVFRGGNFFMPRVFNRFRDELGVAALSQEFDASSLRTRKHLEAASARVSFSRVEISEGRLQAEVSVENLAGHKLPTAYPSRRAWIQFTVRDRNNRTLFESGAFTEKGSIQGNDNDLDPNRYEPHHETITSAEKVQIYEAIMVDSKDHVTTGLLSAVRYAKDNRLLPDGFDKATADGNVAVQGLAALDGDFTASGDRIVYSIPLREPGPYVLEARLWYQPIGYRWAQNLLQRQAAETTRFVKYFDSMAAHSGVILTSASRTVE